MSTFVGDCQGGRFGWPRMVKGMSNRCFLLIVLILCTTIREDNEFGIFGTNADTVTYDHRALIINGQRRILISASLHYPRATPEMWPDLISKAKDGGVDVIETYVFWNVHEPAQGNYNFKGRYDLSTFVKLVQQAGLYVNLRIGPYACAEWSFGGFPVWLLEIPNMHFRTDNEAFKTQMQGFVTKIVNLMKDQQLFASQGGPIILAQIENEYGNIYAPYGSAGISYMRWAASMAQALNTGVPWIMCQQSDAPSYIINTCNGFYCDGWSPNSYDKPKMWTEDWSGWFQKWGEAVPSRPVEDVAFAVARFFERGGTFQNYYMYFGGTNFGRTSGGPYVTTSYDYDAPVDEYGKLRQQKWGHLRDLHKALKLCETALTFGDPQYISLGSLQEAHVYSNGSSICAAFLANTDSGASATVTYNGQTYELPAWSVSILPGCKQVVYNTAKVNAQTSVVTMTHQDIAAPSKILNSKGRQYEKSTSSVEWQYYLEPVGVWSNTTIESNGLLEQISTTKDQTDYLWYTTSVQGNQADSMSAQGKLFIESMRDVMHIFINGVLAGSANTIASGANELYSAATQAVKLNSGTNKIAILSATVGLQNYGAYFETWGAGINGSVLLQGLPSGTQDITKNQWVHQVGLQGEALSIYSTQGTQSVNWVSGSLPQNQPLTWYKTEFDAPEGDDPVALDLGTMGKGQVWVNGESLGRYWSSISANQSGCSTCDYRGAYSASKCRTGCGQPSQRWYHVPRAWLNPTENLLVLFEEIGGDPSGISLGIRSYVSVCSHVTQTHPPPIFTRLDLTTGNRVLSNVTTAQLQLDCEPGYKVSSITFASYGTPKGTCASFQEGKCHAKSSLSVVVQECIGHQHCSLPLSSKKFGEDPCPGIFKSLAVEAVCSTAVIH
ncbi:hypothetical protein O6H91_03G130300 [Diphasiastrum complanatum]|uniref:Uncharacterized protein n=1 Tax=Diphasiastrum complanatum TaxID=34168 RepID=A0ACC2EBM1_DIPCM|nr:hypothetical protein O6H91_03G130300 [Diphasiastrum complanatum]